MPIGWLLIASTAALLLAFLLLPVVIALVGCRSAPDGDVELRADIGICMGLVGMSLRRQEPAWEVSALLAGYAVGRPLRVGGTSHRKGGAPAAAPLEASSRPQPAGPARVESLPVRLRRLAAAVRPLWRPAVGLCHALPTVLGLRRLHVEGTVGLGDPQATGRVCGWLYALAALLHGRVQLQVAPDFTSRGVCGRFELRLHLYLAKLLWILGRFAVATGWGYAAARLGAWWSVRWR